MYSPSSPKNPIGGKSWSKPTTSVPPSAFASSASFSFWAAVSEAASEPSVFVSVDAAAETFSPPEQAVSENAITDASAAHKNLFFIIISSSTKCLMSPLRFRAFGASFFLILYHISTVKQFCKELLLSLFKAAEKQVQRQALNSLIRIILHLISRRFESLHFIKKWMSDPDTQPSRRRWYTLPSRSWFCPETEY